MGGRLDFLQKTKGVLLDISGVLKDGDIPIRGSVQAVKLLQESGIPFRLVTNETLKPSKTIHETLKMLGYRIEEKLMFTPVPALIEILKQENLRPHILMHPRMIPEFKDVDMNNPNCVVIGDAEEYFSYESLNECFRILIESEKKILFTLGLGKYYLDDDGLTMDVGAYTKGLEYAVDVVARPIGKPSREYFLAAVKDMNLEPEEVIMVGDDILHDVGGSQSCGIKGILVRTGKYTEQDENHTVVKPDAIFQNLLEAVKELIARKPKEKVSKV